MAVERKFDTITIVASTDLTGHQFKAVGLNGLIAETSLAAVGILRTKPLNGDHATVAYKGQMKAISGAVINSGSLIGVTTSGFLISRSNIAQVASGTTIEGYVGRAQVQVASGDMFTFIGDFTMGQLA